VQSKTLLALHCIQTSTAKGRKLQEIEFFLSNPVQFWGKKKSLIKNQTTKLKKIDVE
jgi:hypothetical protein